MDNTLIANVIVPEVFNPYVLERTAERAKFYMGGIITADSSFDILATRGGKLINMPFWQDLSGDDEVLSDSSSLTTANITAAQDVAALLMRGRAWQVNDLAHALSGSDPMMAIGDLVSDYWARRMQATLVSSLTGVFADNVANDAGDMTADVAGATVADIAVATKMSGDVFIDGQKTFGDALGQIAGIAMHSHVYNNLKKIDNISFDKESVGATEIERYRGLPIIVDDKLPYTPAAGTGDTDAAAQYTTYLFGNGAFALGQGSAPVPTETDRDSLGGNDILVTRHHYIMHPRGVAFESSSVVGASPSNAELALATNWNRVYERKNVRIAQIITNG